MPRQLSLDDVCATFPAHTRHRRTDPDTSRAAAEVAVADLNEKQAKVLAVLRAFPYGLTDEQLTQICSQWYGWRGSSTARTRRAELTQIGQVERTGERRRVASGLWARVWRASRNVG